MNKIIFFILSLTLLYPCNSNNWFDYFPDNMQGCNLNGANLSGGLDWSNVNLEGATFVNANLENINLQGANLDYTNFQGANLGIARLEDASCYYANFTNADMHYVNAINTNFLWANLTGTDMYGGGWTSQFNMANFCNIDRSPSGDVCIEAMIDNNGDGYDDASFNAGSATGNVNLDGILNVQDVVIIINMILDN